MQKKKKKEHDENTPYGADKTVIMPAPSKVSNKDAKRKEKEKEKEKEKSASKVPAKKESRPPSHVSVSDKLQSQVFIAMPIEEESMISVSDVTVSADARASDDEHDVLHKSKLVEPKSLKKKDQNTEDQEPAKKKKDFIAHQPINVKSNKEAMKVQKDQEHHSKRKQLEEQLRKNLHKNKRSEDHLLDGDAEKEKDKRKVKKKRPVAAASNVPIDQLEQDFSVLDETQFREVTYIMSDDEPEPVVAVTPTPVPAKEEVKKEEPKPESPKKEKEPEVVITPTPTPADPPPEEPPEEKEEVKEEPTPEPTPQPTPEKEKPPTPKEESKVVAPANLDVSLDSDSEDTPLSKSEEEPSDSEEDDDESEEEESSEDSEDERQRRRQQEKEKVKLAAMEPIPEDKSSKKNDDFSSDDDEEESVMSKIGSFLFFGCGGNNKDKGKETEKKKE